ncbi:MULTISPECIES: hypothetical protein [Myroides]|uniref:hypothetical protein n=1 Tax=Myroides TaxID=76831 RepID=UPI0018EF3457|nr:hypothetical protein [Myroides phaeus]
MKKNTYILLGGIALFILAFALYLFDIVNAQTAYFIITISFVMIISPIVIYLFNKLN